MEDFRPPTDVPRPSILYINVDWCPHCVSSRPLMDELATVLGQVVPVLSIDGDAYGEWIMNECGEAIKHLSYPTILFARGDGTYVKFEAERTKENLLAFACEHSQSYGQIDACLA
jgi:thiol-disulfide isomerase/thioredoxin